ncbi:hypothetical protein [Spirillospora sp. NPDC048824]|uniref:hypothetical protein n=1 Tax=Spirillospora sp. NPDC048824 TaxID=3364526 RepID=UPI0037116324
MPQPVGVIDAVGAGAHRRHQRHHLRRRVRTTVVTRTVDSYRGFDHPGQTGPLRKPDHRHQARIGDQVVLVEHRRDRLGGIRGLHLRDASLILRDEAFDKPIIPGHGASLLPFPTPGRSFTGGSG